MIRGGVAMARCSRALMLLCVVYAIVLVLFHQSLSPSSSSTAVDDRKIPVMVRDNDPAEDDAANDTIRWLRSAVDVHKRLQNLEAGMVQLEKQVFDMKISLAERALGEKRARLLDALKTRGPHQQRELSSSAAAGAQSQPQGVLSALKKEEEEEALDYTNSTLIRVSEGLAVFSAYHDDRQEEVWVRIMVIIHGNVNSQRLLCHFHYNGDNTATYIIEAKQYEMCENHKKTYLGFIYSCSVPLGRHLDYTLAVSHVSSNDRQVPVPVQRVSPPVTSGQKVSTDKFAYNFSICVSPLFGSVSPKRLVEFLELTRLLGVQQIFFYDFSTSEVVQRVLRHYEGKRWVTVIPWRMPEKMSSNIWYNGQLVVNNDCLYRTMAQSVYTAFHDIDEFIVPHSKDARIYSDIIPPELPNDTCGYSFASAFFDAGVATQFPDDLMTVFSTARSEAISKVRTKVMVMPRRVFEVGIHHVSKQLLEPWESRPFSPERALLHHYRECLDDYGMRCDSWVKDTTIREHYMPELKIRMATAVEALKL